MEFKDIKKKDNAVLHRVEIEAVVCFEKATPSNKEVKAALSKQAGVEPKHSIVKHMYTRFGETCADVLMFAYKDEASFLKVERLKELPKDEEASEGEAAQEASQPVEKPAEEKTEAPAEAKEEKAEGSE